MLMTKRPQTHTPTTFDSHTVGENFNFTPSDRNKVLQKTKEKQSLLGVKRRNPTTYTAFTELHMKKEK